MTATLPFETRQQSSRWNGSAIQRDAWWSSIVSGVRNCAIGLRQAQARVDTAIAPSCSLVVPYSCMWRRAAMA